MKQSQTFPQPLIFSLFIEKKVLPYQKVYINHVLKYNQLLRQLF
ncbi:Uncharacterized protein BN1224_CV14_A_10500 [Chlamydia pneumoniae]|uniref:Uncharacterized protein n=1 Tax=Chlamydia pneumoniae TaxID=83558 RepID=Q9K1W8_CHLPN|nr:hypothetical protein CP_0853 [Chlamydia pneumoniae AR39]CRI33542.1 Uncharacterized protein BN1224_Wien1_A_10490 [Chlamydia pneumoniae]CRI36407.1 Uncharacterized protein BN1224_CM1_A_10540 [Chlamydia pneumoniae]CRI37531.1 Uncharacterized protein BN1224_CV14_A_10500 [Chlamydia pneumoniae]CRI38663.1 Uncharacterized protein BN1224_CV15_C_04960 [Chlamydia pneumoniae]